MKAIILLTTLALSTAPVAADTPVYELVWPVGNALFRWHNGGPEIALRTKAPIDTVCAAKGGWIGFTSGANGFLLGKGATGPVKLAGLARKGKLKDILSCRLDRNRLLVEVQTPDYDEIAGIGDSRTLELPLPKGTVAVPLALPTPPESEARSPGGKYAFAETTVRNKFGDFAVLKRVAAGGGGTSLLGDMWQESEGRCHDEEGEPGCSCPFSLGRKGWLPGDIAWVEVFGEECGHGSSMSEVRVMAADGTEVISGSPGWHIEDTVAPGLRASPDGRHWHIGSHICGPDGTCVALPSQAAAAVWSER